MKKNGLQNTKHGSIEIEENGREEAEEKEEVEIVDIWNSCKRWSR